MVTRMKWSHTLAIAAMLALTSSLVLANMQVFDVLTGNNVVAAGSVTTPTVKGPTTVLTVLSSHSDGIITNSNEVDINIDGAPQWFFYGNESAPYYDNTVSVGASGRMPAQSWSYQYSGGAQTVAAAASITLNPATGGESITINLGATAITTVNSVAGSPAQHITTTICEDATGSRSISGWATGTNGFRFAGGSYTPTATASKCDKITWEWSAVSTAWLEQSRSMNL